MTSDLMPRLGGARTWKDDEPLECASVVPDGLEVVSFWFGSPSGAWFDFRPGQFLMLALPVPGGTVHRICTIPSSPSRPLSITLTVKAAGASTGIRRMLDNIREARRSRRSGPWHLRPGRAPRAQAVAELRGLGRDAHDGDHHLARGSRRQARHLLRPVRGAALRARLPPASGEHGQPRAVDQASRRRQRRRPAWCLIGLSWPVQPADARPDGAGLPRARSLLLWVGAVHAGGPRHADRLRLRHGSLPSGDLHGSGAVADAPVLDDVVPSAEAEVVFAVSGRPIPCTEADIVLAISRQAGLNILSGCSSGVCGTCKTRKLAGRGAHGP